MADQLESGDLLMKKILPSGPQEEMQYPIKVEYCGECSMPLEYCEYYSNFAKCKEWLKKNLPEAFAQLNTNQPENQEAAEDDQSKKRQKRGGKALLKTKQKQTGEKLIKLSRSNRGKKKYVTYVQGLNAFDIDLKEASKFFANKFACGSSVFSADEIVIQGDVKDDLYDVITDKWPDVEEDLIEDLGDVKR